MIQHKKYDKGIDVYSVSIQGVLVDEEEIDSKVYVTKEDIIQLHVTENTIVKYLESKGYTVTKRGDV